MIEKTYLQIVMEEKQDEAERLFEDAVRNTDASSAVSLRAAQVNFETALKIFREIELQKAEAICLA